MIDTLTEASLVSLASWLLIVYCGVRLILWLYEGYNGINLPKLRISISHWKYDIADWMLSFPLIERAFVRTSLINGALIDSEPQQVKHIGSMVHCSTGPAISGGEFTCWVRFGRVHRDKQPAMMFNNLIRFYRNGELQDEKGTLEGYSVMNMCEHGYTITTIDPTNVVFDGKAH